MTSDKRKIDILTEYAEKQGMTLEELGAKIESSIVNDGEFGRRTPEEIEALFKEPKETTIEGWIAVDEWGIGGCFLHTQKPHAESREFCDTGEYEIGWESDGDKFELDSKLFPDMDPESEPKKYRITITPME